MSLIITGIPFVTETSLDIDGTDTDGEVFPKASDGGVARWDAAKMGNT
jgi:hypothetical protein